MASKFYVVWKGREPGIYTDWMSCKKQVDGFTGARYKSYPTRAEAEEAFKGSSSVVFAGKSSSGSKGTGAKKGGLKSYTAEEVNALKADTKIFTDGGCDPNPGNAGSGIAIYRDNVLDELWYGLYNPRGTNNTAELNALHQAMLIAQKEIKKDSSVVIFCDSKYSIQCITQWAAGWEKKGWKKSGGEIKNLALIQTMYALYQEVKDEIKIHHVNGHVGIEGNELADRMSILAIEKKDKRFHRYAGDMNIPYLLAMRTG
ncbi:ribonuclease H family protein [Pleionea sp. CnH1-48]|uniref:ribonuclease H family protein n=1 Tax=Pleionea sp. CnH1-48 TaxID=2954494 RepID=UPI0020968801|nr:ribonuclease H family protein [Pleionea sp. CnH1-48]MCO7224953.1 ribonuclease H family protein [Pleionea sp. CnH1-48]